MPTSQHAYQPNTDLAQHYAQVTNMKPEHVSIDLEHVSVSELLGRDYLFINSKEVDLPLKNPPVFYALLDEVIQQLELAETHTVAVSYQESASGLAFIRHDLTWHKHKICRVESIAITNPEQKEFMEMIWHCSTAAID